MTIEETYINFLNHVNRNNTNNNISVDRPRFVMLFNDVAIRYVEWILNKRNEDNIRYVESLLVLDKSLEEVGITEVATKFELPENYFDFSNLSVYASKDKSKKVKLKTWEIKSEDVEEIYHDINNEPSFDYRETFYFFTSGTVAVYKKDFDVDRVLLTYYRYPQKVDISGYIDVDGNDSTNIDPEFDDKVVGRIIIAMAKAFASNVSDPNNFQLKSSELFESI